MRISIKGEVFVYMAEEAVEFTPTPSILIASMPRPIKVFMTG